MPSIKNLDSVHRFIRESPEWEAPKIGRPGCHLYARNRIDGNEYSIIVKDGPFGADLRFRLDSDEIKLTYSAWRTRVLVFKVFGEEGFFAIANPAELVNDGTFKLENGGWFSVRGPLISGFPFRFDGNRTEPILPNLIAPISPDIVLAQQECEIRTKMAELDAEFERLRQKVAYIELIRKRRRIDE